MKSTLSLATAVSILFLFSPSAHAAEGGTTPPVLDNSALGSDGLGQDPEASTDCPCRTGKVDKRTAGTSATADGSGKGLVNPAL